MSQSVMELVAGARAAVPSISPEDLRSLMTSADPLVLDVRDHPEVAQTGIIPGAVHVTRGMLEFRADPQSPLHDPVFTKDRTVVLYCASGGRSALAGKALLDLGYADVRNLGGLGAWTKTGGPVEGGDSDEAKGA